MGSKDAEIGELDCNPVDAISARWFVESLRGKGGCKNRIFKICDTVSTSEFKLEAVKELWSKVLRERLIRMISGRTEHKIGGL